MQIPIPFGARDASIIVESDCHPTLAELDGMPQELINTIILYKAVKMAIETGTEINL